MNINEIEFIILLAGKSTRNYPHAKGLAHKSLIPFGSRKIIDYIMSEITEAKGTSVSLVVSSKEAQKSFENCFSREKDVEQKLKKSNNLIGLELLKSIYIKSNLNINYIIQKKPKGLAHAIGLVANKIKNKHFAIILPDDIIVTHDGVSIIKKVVDQYLADDIGGNLFLTREVEDTSRWGIIENGIFKEKPKATTSNEASSMFFILDKNFVKTLGDLAKKMAKFGTRENRLSKRGTEFHYADYINEFIKNSDKNMKIRTYKLDPKDTFLDCGTIDGYEKALLYTLINNSSFNKENVDFIKKLLG